MLKMDARLVEWPLKEPFRISRETLYSVRCIQVTLSDANDNWGHGEAVGVDYAGETPEMLIEQLIAVRAQIENGVSIEQLQSLLPAGGARNALDCALWDLRAKQSGIAAWVSADLQHMAPRPTAVTFGIMTDQDLRRMAAHYAHFPLLKVKTDQDHGIDPVRIVHEVAPSARVILDPNQAWGEAELTKYSPQLPGLGVVLLEQPVAIDADDILDRLRLTVPVAADEAFNDRLDISRLANRYQVLNIKLDKTGGLTEAIACVHQAKEAGLGLMVGCMIGSSLSMAPATIIAQYCDFVDLDGPLLQAADCDVPIQYENGTIHPPHPKLWG
ncbi:MAG: dipeptide epimerase [Sphingopyxis sp.]|nr:dipeptide epimerase [Sphingopyxis sp.]